MMRLVLIFWLIVYSLRRRVVPYHFFQLNSDYFNSKKSIFSKLDMDRYIPQRWRLRQVEDDGRSVPAFPVFLKPEWGQNSHGVLFLRNKSDLREAREKEVVKRTAYLFQEVAWEKYEYDIFYIRSADYSRDAALFSITEVRNSGQSEPVVNGVYNKDSSYHDITEYFTPREQEQLWTMVREVGNFRIARVGLRADSKEELLAGDFHIIEINIFLPLPLLLLDDNICFSRKYQFAKKYMNLAAGLMADLPVKTDRHAIFFKQLVAHYKVKGC